MDASRFDAIARSLTDIASRRTVLGLAAGVLSGLLGQSQVAAKPCKNGCGRCKRCKDGKCKPQNNGTPCGGSKVCKNGKCRCPKECCADRDCAPGQECLPNGSCATPCTTQDDCLPDCACGLPTTEGTQHCIRPDLGECPTDTCDETKDCPQGEQCQLCETEPICFPLCNP
jgi:hypothetical protein